MDPWRQKGENCRLLFVTVMNNLGVKGFGLTYRLWSIKGSQAGTEAETMEGGCY